MRNQYEAVDKSIMLLLDHRIWVLILASFANVSHCHGTVEVSHLPVLQYAPSMPRWNRGDEVGPQRPGHKNSERVSFGESFWISMDFRFQGSVMSLKCHLTWTYETNSIAHVCSASGKTHKNWAKPFLMLSKVAIINCFSPILAPHITSPTTNNWLCRGIWAFHIAFERLISSVETSSKTSVEGSNHFKQKLPWTIHFCWEVQIPEDVKMSHKMDPVQRRQELCWFLPAFITAWTLQRGIASTLPAVNHWL